MSNGYISPNEQSSQESLSSDDSNRKHPHNRNTNEDFHETKKNSPMTLQQAFEKIMEIKVQYNKNQISKQDYQKILSEIPPNLFEQIKQLAQKTKSKQLNQHQNQKQQDQQQNYRKQNQIVGNYKERPIFLDLQALSRVIKRFTDHHKLKISEDFDKILLLISKSTEKYMTKTLQELVQNSYFRMNVPRNYFNINESRSAKEILNEISNQNDKEQLEAEKIKEEKEQQETSLKNQYNNPNQTFKEANIIVSGLIGDRPLKKGKRSKKLDENQNKLSFFIEQNSKILEEGNNYSIVEMHDARSRLIEKMQGNNQLYIDLVNTRIHHLQNLLLAYKTVLSDPNSIPNFDIPDLNKKLVSLNKQLEWNKLNLDQIQREAPSESSQEMFRAAQNLKLFELRELIEVYEKPIRGNRSLLTPIDPRFSDDDIFPSRKLLDFERKKELDPKNQMNPFSYQIYPRVITFKDIFNFLENHPNRFKQLFWKKIVARQIK